MTDERDKAADVLTEAAKPDVQLWWLSFVGEEGFRGVAIVDAPTFFEAVMKSHALGINPGGELQGYPCPDASLVPAEHIDRLLSLAELRAHKPYGIRSLSELESPRCDEELN
ncbi:MAG: hypothetical protein ABW217_03830 [Polyangiaceae bacterium]